jgi:hypothetical protein
LKGTFAPLPLCKSPSSRPLARGLKLKFNRYFSSLFVLIFILVSCASVDPGKRLDSARNNVSKEKYEAALDDYFWYHNNALKYDYAYAAVRQSYAISEWVALGELYPKALQKLINIRDEKTEKILTGHGSFNLFSDVSAINSNLKETEKTVQLFLEIIKFDSELANSCYIFAKEDLIKHKKFKICNNFLKDIDRELFLMKYFLDYNIKNYPSDSEDYLWFINNYIKEAENIILILLNNSRADEAVKFLTEASKNVKENKIISELEVLKKKYFANKAN